MKKYCSIYLGKNRILVWDKPDNSFGVFTTPDGNSIGHWVAKADQDYWNITVEAFGASSIVTIEASEDIFSDIPLSAAMTRQP